MASPGPAEAPTPSSRALPERALSAIFLDDDLELRRLTDLGLDPDQLDVSGAPLAFHCAQGSPNCLSLLLALGARPSAPCPDGTTPAMRAARCSPECLSILLELPGVWDDRDKGGRSVLHHAALGSSDCSPNAHAALLLACSAAPGPCFSEPSAAGLTPFELALLHDSPNAARALLARSPFNLRAAIASMERNPAMAEALARPFAIAELEELRLALAPGAPEDGESSAKRL